MVKRFVHGALVVLCLMAAACSAPSKTSTHVEKPLAVEKTPNAEGQTRRDLGIPASGDAVIVYAYCRYTPEVLTSFIESLIVKGMVGYVETMINRSIDCFDIRIMDEITPIQVTLVRHLGEVTLLEGDRIAIWLFRDSRGDTGFTWFEAKGSEA